MLEKRYQKWNYIAYDFYNDLKKNCKLNEWITLMCSNVPNTYIIKYYKYLLVMMKCIPNLILFLI